MKEMNPSTEEVGRQFERLVGVLEYRMLPTRNMRYKKRIADASEFQLMWTDDDGRVAAFKHTATRNYVYVKKDIDGDDYLKVPDDGSPFHEGVFDV
jgi:hypothetical protein